MAQAVKKNLEPGMSLVAVDTDGDKDHNILTAF
jgi:hypothetical protein